MTIQSKLDIDVFFSTYHLLGKSHFQVHILLVSLGRHHHQGGAELQLWGSGHWTSPSFFEPKPNPGLRIS